MLTNIEQAYALVTAYTQKTSRPGIADLMTFDILLDMHEQDDSDPYIWSTSPDVVMQHMVDNNQLFTIEYGWEDMWDSIRDYVVEHDFVKDVDEDEEDEEEDNDN